MPTALARFLSTPLTLLLAGAPLAAASVPGPAVHPVLGPAVAGKLEVWVDDARTRRIEVDELDPREVADSCRLKLSLGASFGNVGISFGWSREKGVEYGKRARALIERIEALCKEFNRGEMTLETYSRRMRAIVDAAQTAQLCRLEILAATSLESDDAGRRLDRALGLPEADGAEHRRKVEAALADFRALVEGIDQPAADDEAPRETSAPRSARESAERALARIDTRLSAGAARSLGEAERITIWADRARTRRIVVPKLDVEHLVDDFEDSLGLKLKYSAPLYSLSVGPKMTRTLHEKAEYDSAATLLLVKYRALCLEYNSGILCQEVYVERLEQLYEAERRAADARGRFLDQLDAAVDSARDRLRDHLGRDDSAALRDMEARKREIREGARTQSRETAENAPDGERSLVEEMSADHVAGMRAQEAFHGAVEAFEVELPRSAIEVWVDDARTRKVRVPRLDTDLLAQSVKTRIRLHIRYMGFGPEAEWARDRGLEYDAAAQELIVKSKQLCMDYNAGLVPQETFDRRRAAIDASVERAALVRERVIEFTRALKGSARDELDRRLEMRRQK